MNWKIIYEKQVSSSMDYLKSLKDDFSNDESIVLHVESQSIGRGRQGRAWESPEGGLYCSILFRPKTLLKEVPKMTLLAAVAVCEAVRSVSAVQAEIKWPNDLLVNEKKLAGILTESEIAGQMLEYVIIGIGVNVNTRIEDLPREAVSLNHLTGREYDLKLFLDAVLDRFEFWIDDVAQNGFDNMLNRWRKLCGMLSQRVRTEMSQGIVEGVAVDIADDGGLMIEKDDGAVVKVTSGDVVSARRIV